MFFLIPFVSDSWEEPSRQTFVLVKTYWRRLEDVLKTSWRRLQCNIFCLIRCLENLLKTSCEEILKTYWRRLEDVFGRRIANTSWRCLEDVLEDEKLLRWRRLGKQEMLAGYYFALINNIFFRTTMQLNSFRYVSKVIIVIVLDINHSSFSRSFGKDLKFRVACIK